MLPLNGADTTQQRYRRQLLIDGWGQKTQDRLAASRVFIAGAGGLGCPVALNLTSAGIGRITICDCDTVDSTNLNRQFLHREDSIGVPKTDSALQFLTRFNSGIEFTTHGCRITEDNVDDLVGDADIIMDCLDNFEARYALNRCAMRRDIPLVHGAVWGLEGRVTVFHPPQTPCLACMFPVPPPEQEIPVLGTVTSATGSVQAMEAILFLAGMHTPLQGEMLIMDYSSMYFQSLTIGRRPDCPACGHL
jgi:adenylyltransferase/sulfurtransferase